MRHVGRLRKATMMCQWREENRLCVSLHKHRINNSAPARSAAFRIMLSHPGLAKRTRRAFSVFAAFAVLLFCIRVYIVNMRSFLWPPCVADADVIFLPRDFYLLFYSSPNLSGHRLDVYHTSTHDVALVRI